MKHIMRCTCRLVGLLAILAVGSLHAMTQAELQSAINAAEPGGTVYVTSDIVYDGAFTVTKSLTLASAEGSTFTLTRADSYASGNFVTLSTEGVNLTLANLIVDGNKEAGKTADVAVEISAGTVTLENGFVLRNFYGRNFGSGFYVHAGGHLVMNDGAAIRDLENDQYGVAVLVGHGKSDDKAEFTMNGGLITGCADHHATASEEYGGAVYIYGWGTTFRGKGGKIVDNTSDNCVAGVNAYLGNVEIEGDFIARDNRGSSTNGVAFRCESGVRSIQVTGDYSGEMTLKFYGSNKPDVSEGTHPTQLYTSTINVRRKGCANITLEDAPGFGIDLDEKLSGNWYGTVRRVAARRLIAQTGRRENVFSFDVAFAAAEAGDTLALCANVSVTKTYSVSNDVTITSATGGPYAFERAAKNVAILRVSVKDDVPAKLTLKDVIVDGMDVESEKWGQGIALETGTELVLDSGAVIRNVSALGGGAAVSASVGARLVMKEGVKIENCYTPDAKSYGSAVRIGQNGFFEMTGGLITGCHSALEGADVAAGYGGIVYVAKDAVFDMTGGAITGNTEANGCGGVVNYLGTVKVSGSAIIADNNGPYSDVFNCGVRRTLYYGDFRGRVGIANTDQSESEVTKVERADENATGAWCFYPATLTGSSLVGKDDNGKVVWAAAIGSVEGVKAATVDDLALLLPTALDLHEDSADLSRLPIVLTGAATELGGTLTLSFDKDSRKHQLAWSIPLLKAGAGESLTGAWSFILPDGADRWAVWSFGGGYEFGYHPLGMQIVIR